MLLWTRPFSMGIVILDRFNGDYFELIGLQIVFLSWDTSSSFLEYLIQLKQTSDQRDKFSIFAQIIQFVLRLFYNSSWWDNQNGNSRIRYNTCIWRRTNKEACLMLRRCLDYIIFPRRYRPVFETNGIFSRHDNDAAIFPIGSLFPKWTRFPLKYLLFNTNTCIANFIVLTGNFHSQD